MQWIIFAISAHFLWAVENVGTKYVIGNKIRNPYAFAVLFSGAMGMAVLLLPFLSVSFPAPHDWVFITLAGVLYFYAGLPYYKAIEIEEVSRINILWNLIPIISLPLGWVAGDVFKSIQILAIFVLFGGGLLASLHLRNGAGHPLISRALFLMLVSCTGYALEAVLFRMATKTTPVATAFVWMAMISAVSTLLLLGNAKVRLGIKEVGHNAGFHFWLFLVILFICADVGMFLNQRALALQPAALAFSFEGLQTLFVFGMVAVINHLRPGVMREKLDKKSVALKFAALICVFVGIWLLSR